MLQQRFEIFYDTVRALLTLPEYVVVCVCVGGGAYLVLGFKKVIWVLLEGLIERLDGGGELV